MRCKGPDDDGMAFVTGDLKGEPTGRDEEEMYVSDTVTMAASCSICVEVALDAPSGVTNDVQNSKSLQAPKGINAFGHKQLA